jgi:hypothetical protein
MRSRHTHARAHDDTGQPTRRRRRTRAARFAVAAAAAVALSTGGLAATASAATPDVRLVEASSPTTTVLNMPGRHLLFDSQGRVAGQPHHGDLAGVRLNAPITAGTGTVSGNGYWLAGADGGVFAFGDARFHGGLGHLRLNQPIVAMVPTPSGGGYLLAAADGGVFAFGDARFRGSMGGTPLNQPIVSIAVTPSGNGYWLAARDGGVFSFGDARFHGSGIDLDRRFEAIIATPAGDGYWLVGREGLVQGFGAASTASVTVPAGTEVASVDNRGVHMQLAVAAKPAPPPPPAPAVAASSVGGVPAWKVSNFEALSMCESGGNWSINTGNGYYGGLQFALSSWRAVGGTGMPHQHSKAEQIYRAHLLQERQGWGAWPACSRKLGIR